MAIYTVMGNEIKVESADKDSNGIWINASYPDMPGRTRQWYVNEGNLRADNGIEEILAAIREVNPSLDLS